MTMPDEGRAAAIGRVIEGLIEANRHVTRPRVTPFAGHHLGRSHLDLLFLVAHRTDVTPGFLASELKITPGAVSQLVATLRNAGLVTAEPNPADSRSVLLRLSNETKFELDEFESRVVGAAIPRFASLSLDDLTQLARLLGAVKEAR